MFLLYCDEDSMAHDLVRALRARNMDVLTAFEAGMIDRSDEEHLEFATRQGRVLFNFNRGDFHRIHSLYLAEGKAHTGIVLANQQQYAVGEIMRRILRLAAATSGAEMQSRIEFLNAWG